MSLYRLLSLLFHWHLMEKEIELDEKGSLKKPYNSMPFILAFQLEQLIRAKSLDLRYFFLFQFP